MRRGGRVLQVGLLALFVAACAGAGSAVEPASCAITNVRDEAVSYASQLVFYEGNSLRLTNCVMYADTAGVELQMLTNVTITVSVGTTATNVDYVGTVTSASQGKWAATIVVPAFVTAPYVQVKITDEHTNSYIYPWKGLYTTPSM